MGAPCKKIVLGVGEMDINFCDWGWVKMKDPEEHNFLRENKKTCTKNNLYKAVGY